MDKKELRKSLNHYQALLKETHTYAERVWIELQIIELKKSLKELKTNTQ